MSTPPTDTTTCCRGTGVRLGETPASEDDLKRLRLLDTSSLLARYRWGVELFDPRLFSLDDARLDRRFDDPESLGTWSCRELVAHLADADLSLSFRIRRVLAEDGPLLEPWDEQAFIASGLYGRIKPGASVATIYTLRVALAELLETLDDTQWNRRGLHRQFGEMTTRRLVEIATWHLERHAWFLNRKIHDMLGPPGDDDHACGCSCACKNA